MATKQIAWNTGNGNITLTYTGQGNGTILVSSDANDIGTERSQTIRVQTTNGAIVKNLTIKQAACPVPVGGYGEVSLLRIGKIVFARGC